MWYMIIYSNPYILRITGGFQFLHFDALELDHTYIYIIMGTFYPSIQIGSETKMLV